MTMSFKAILIALLFAAPANAQQMPPGVPDPDQAILDPAYSDPVFFWRITNQPKDPFEPEPYFYWPAGVIVGKPGPFLPEAAAGRTTVPAKALETAAAWAESHKSNALIVVHRGVVQMEKYWHDTKPDELVNGRAITRSVTPMLLGFAVADGKLKLDDPIGKYIPAWRDDPRGRITVRQVAQNVSGLEAQIQLPAEQIFGNKDLCLAYCGDAVRAAMSYPLVTPPGTKFEVAQENTQLLAHIIERATGTPIQTLLSERVWKRIGADDAAFQLDRPGGAARTMCCMRATPRAWARLGVLVLQGGKWNGEQILPAAWTDEMGKPSARNPNFGTGLWLGSPYVAKRTYFEGRPGNVPQSEPFLAEDVRIMEGGGYRTIFIVPSAELMIFRHGQSDPNWDHAFLVNAVLRGLKG